jgi:hypothetical protein
MRTSLYLSGGVSVPSVKTADYANAARLPLLILA